MLKLTPTLRSKNKKARAVRSQPRAVYNKPFTFLTECIELPLTTPIQRFAHKRFAEFIQRLAAGAFKVDILIPAIDSNSNVVGL